MNPGRQAERPAEGLQPPLDQEDPVPAEERTAEPATAEPATAEPAEERAAEPVGNRSRPQLPPVPPAAPRGRRPATGASPQPPSPQPPSPQPPSPQPQTQQPQSQQPQSHRPDAPRRSAPLPPAPYREAPPPSAPYAEALGGGAGAPPAAVAPPPVHGPATPALPPLPPAAPAAAGDDGPRRVRTPLPPPPPPGRRRFVPHPEEEFTQLIPVLPPVPRPTDESDEEVEQREGAPGGSRGILRAAGTMAVATLVSRLTGVLRSVVLLAALGAQTLVGDAYNTSNTLPNIVYELLLGGVLSSVVIPLLVRAQERDADGGIGYAQRLATIAVTALSILTVVAILVAPALTWAYGIRDNPGQVELANWLARLLLVEIVFYGIGALATAMLNARNVFGPPAWAPVLNNVVVIITGVLFIAASGPGELTPLTISSWQVWLLGIGTTLGIAAQALVLVPVLRREGMPLRPRWGLKNTGLREAGTLGLWVIAYAAISQVGVIVATNVANAAGRADAPGSNAFATASLLFQMPYGIIGVALLTALLPRMSRAAARGDLPGVVQDLSLGTRLSSLGLLPVTAVLCVLGPQLATVLFARGQTSVDDARAVGTALAVGAFGLLPMAVTLLQLRVFYAMKDARTPTLIQVGMVTVRVPLLLAVPALVDPEHVVAGLMLVTSITYLAGWVIGDIALRRAVGTLRTRETLLTVARIAAASAAAALLGALVVWPLGHVLGTSVAGSLGILVIGTVVIGVAAVGGIALARVPEVQEPLTALRARFRRG